MVKGLVCVNFLQYSPPSYFFRTAPLVIASPADSWRNTRLTLQYHQSILGSFSFGKRPLVWDSYECHIQSVISADLKLKKFEEVIVL